MTDTLTKAKELIERFDGKITERWTGIRRDGVVVKQKGENTILPWTDPRMGLAIKAPQMLTIIKELVGMIDVMERAYSPNPLYKDHYVKQLEEIGDSIARTGTCDLKKLNIIHATTARLNYLQKEYQSQRNWNIRMEADHDILMSEVSETREMNEKLEQENQALKSRQVRMRPMQELLDGKQEKKILLVHETGVESLYFCLAGEFPYFDDGNGRHTSFTIKAKWIDPSDLPTEIEVTK